MWKCVCGGGGGGGGGRGGLYTYRYTVSARVTPVSIKMGSDVSHFNVSEL